MCMYKVHVLKHARCFPRIRAFHVSSVCVDVATNGGAPCVASAHLPIGLSCICYDM